MPPVSPLTIRIDQIHVVRLDGELDLHTGRHLTAATSVIPKDHAVVVDLAGITFCDCAGYRALRAVSLDLAHRGLVHVTGTPPVIDRIASLPRA